MSTNLSKQDPTGDSQVGTTPEVTGTPSADTARRRIGSTLVRNGLLMLLAFVGIALLLETLSPFRVSQLGVMAYYLPAIAGLTVLTGLNGQISLGHGALMAVGGYTTAVLLERQEGLPFLLVLLISAVVAGVVGLVVGAAAARLHGPYLAGATLALAVGLPGLALKFDEFLGGDQGLRVSPPRAPDGIESFYESLMGDNLSGQRYLAYYGWIIALVVLLLLSNLVNSRYGRHWRAVRDDEVAAELAGIDLGRMRVQAFVVSAVCAGVGGSLLAVVTRLIAPTSVTIVLSFGLLTAIVIGGLGSLLGAVIGAAVLVFMQQIITDTGLDAGLDASQAANIAPLVYGVLLIVVMLAAPRGLVGTVRMAWSTRAAARRAGA
ncbi:MAG: ABC-type branched-chain amino acid transport system, permease component [Frankiales bacterium]|jgi:branched-chain amino acid transport system permease protein|nr:ABC-type branched-chain amino acid transport system, permease component [Frankiales bacterium]